MSEQKVSMSARGGIGFFGALTILFIALKLTGVINWSWLWVLAPLWVPYAVIGIFVFTLFFLYGVAALLVFLIERFIDFCKKHTKS